MVIEKGWIYLSLKRMHHKIFIPLGSHPTKIMGEDKEKYSLNIISIEEELIKSMEFRGNIVYERIPEY